MVGKMAVGVKTMLVDSGDGGLVVRLRTLDQGVTGSNPTQTVRFF